MELRGRAGGQALPPLPINVDRHTDDAFWHPWALGHHGHGVVLLLVTLLLARLLLPAAFVRCYAALESARGRQQRWVTLILPGDRLTAWRVQAPYMIVCAPITCATHGDVPEREGPAIRTRWRLNLVQHAKSHTRRLSNITKDELGTEF